MRKIDSIILHCTSTPEGKDYSVAEIRRWHVVGNGWNDIGYHYIVHPDGSVDAGRPVEQIGAHCKGHNSTSIGVAYIGGMTADMKSPKDTMTEAQNASMVQLVRELMQRYRILSSKIYGHREFEQKACPSFDVQDWKRRNAL